MKKPYLLKTVLPEAEHKELQNLAMNLWATDKSTYDEGFGRHQWAIWDGTHRENIEPLRKFHEMLLPLAKEEFESETLVPSWCLISIYEGEKARLWKHIDDNACTYHINYTIFHKTPWDFYVEGEKFQPEENDAVISYGESQEHWREQFPNRHTNLVANAFFFYTEPDHWFFKKGPQYLYTNIRKQNEKRILVSLANYCDPEFYSTVQSLWQNAENKERLFFSIVSEDNIEYDLSFIPKNQLLYRHFDLSEYRGGVCWARNLATQVPIDYDYFIQFDSHTQASLAWDSLAVKRYEKMNVNDEKFIIAYAPSDYEIMPDGLVNLSAGSEFSMYGYLFDELVPGFKFPGYRVLEKDEIVRSYWATCCYLFAPKAWVDEVGINGEESFNTEEFALSLRTYAKDWKIYSIGTRDVFHNQSHRQANGSVTREILRPWADDRKEFYWEHVEKSTNRLSMLMSGQLDVPKEKVEGFLIESGIDTKYLDFVPDYVSHIIVEPRSLGMPPRRDK